MVCGLNGWCNQRLGWAYDEGLLCVLQEVRRVWIGYLSQCDSRLGQNIAQKLQAKGAL